LPHKLPPPKDALPVTGLPMLGYLEQTAATNLVKALTAVGNFKPKYPFLTPARSAQLYVAYHLKGKHNLVDIYIYIYKGNICLFQNIFLLDTSIYTQNF
jgi:adenylate/nucleoside-diphosphate kinase